VLGEDVGLLGRVARRDDSALPAARGEPCGGEGRDDGHTVHLRRVRIGAEQYSHWNRHRSVTHLSRAMVVSITPNREVM